MNDPFDDSMERLADSALLDADRSEPSGGSRRSAFELADTDPELRPVDEYGLLVEPAAPDPRVKPADGEPR